MPCECVCVCRCVCHSCAVAVHIYIIRYTKRASERECNTYDSLSGAVIVVYDDSISLPKMMKSLCVPETKTLPADIERMRQRTAYIHRRMELRKRHKICHSINTSGRERQRARENESESSAAISINILQTKPKN